MGERKLERLELDALEFQESTFSSARIFRDFEVDNVGVFEVLFDGVCEGMFVTVVSWMSMLGS